MVGTCMVLPKATHTEIFKLKKFEPKFKVIQKSLTGLKTYIKYFENSAFHRELKKELNFLVID